jgi:PEP-CTERM motif
MELGNRRQCAKRVSAFARPAAFAAAIFSAAALFGAALAPTGAQAGTIVTWEFSTGSIFDTNVFTPANQPASFFEPDLGREIEVTAGSNLFGSNLARPLVQTVAGLGVCSGAEFPFLPLQCIQVDRIGPNEYIRIDLGLAGNVENILSVRVGIVTPFGSNPDDIVIAGANVFDPGFAQLTTLVSGAIPSIGTQVIPSVFDIAINGSGFDYLFLAANTNNNDGFSLLSVTAQVPEPSALALFGLGLIALGVVRRRRR